jgi:glucose-1-phosphate thymidylyltransferase
MAAVTSRALVLARGLGRRMQRADDGAVLTEDQKKAADSGLKSFLPMAGRPFLDYVLGSLADAGIESVGLVVAPEHEQMARYYRADHPPERLRIDFVVQDQPRGTADAVVAAQDWVSGQPFLVMNADNLYPSGMLRRLCALDEPGLPVFTRSNLVRTSNIPDERIRSFALLSIDADGYLSGIVEKPDEQQFAAAGPSACVSMNCWRFDQRIFSFCRDVPLSARGEFELPQAVGAAVSGGVRFNTVPARGPVLDLSTRGDATEVERRLAGITPRP